MGFALEVGQRGPFLNAPPNAKAAPRHPPIRLGEVWNWELCTSADWLSGCCEPEITCGRKAGPSHPTNSFSSSKTGPSFYFSGMRQRAVMLELRASIVAIQYSPNKSRSERAWVRGQSGVRVSNHSATMSRSFWSHCRVFSAVNQGINAEKTWQAPVSRYRAAKRTATGLTAGRAAGRSCSILQSGRDGEGARNWLLSPSRFLNELIQRSRQFATLIGAVLAQPSGYLFGNVSNPPFREV
jgi:hypothetical protein